MHRRAQQLVACVSCVFDGGRLRLGLSHSFPTPSGCQCQMLVLPSQNSMALLVSIPRVVEGRW